MAPVRDNANSEPPLPPLLADVLQRRREVVWRFSSGEFAAAPAEFPVGVLSGSFNPLHAGHRELRRIGEEILNGPVHFELPVVNAEKPPLDVPTIQQRLAQFRDVSVAVTAAATFVEKAAILPGVTFVVGMDTAVRILEPRFYGGGEESMHEALDRIAAAGCRFLVAGRKLESEFQTIHDLSVPLAYRRLFGEIPPEMFRSDVSSTEIRKSD